MGSVSFIPYVSISVSFIRFQFANLLQIGVDHSRNTGQLHENKQDRAGPKDVVGKWSKTHIIFSDKS
jgi:hypothetical protein